MRRVRVPIPASSATAPLRASSVPAISDLTLVKRAREGDPWAKEALFRRHVHFIAGLAGRLLGSRDEAEDVVQDTFVAALASLDAFKETAPFRTWLAGITVHKVHRRFRRRKLLRILGLERSSHDAMLAARSRDENAPEVRDKLRRLDEALHSMPDVDRAAWLLRYVEGYSLEETARLAETSLTTAKRRIARAHTIVCLYVDVEEVTSV